MRVLVIEDDAALGLFLQKGLQLEGHEVHLAADGETGLERAVTLSPDLMVLDLSLPRRDGVQVLRALDGRLRGTSVLVLTGRHGIEDRVECLNLGADDCLLKPFSFSELTARCRALLRRRGQFADPRLSCADVELDRMQRRVTRAGRSVELTVKEFALLEYLMQARGRVCSRAELLREVWQMSPEAGTNVVDVYINYLRRKLGAAREGALDMPANAREQDRVIETVRGAGYAMAGADSLRKPPMPAIPDGLHAALRGTGTGAWGLGGRASA